MAKSRRFEDDDRDDYDDRPRRKAGGDNTAIKIIALVGGVLLLMVLLCGGLFFYGCYSVKKGVERSQDQMFEQLEKMRQEQEKQRQEQEKQAAADRAESRKQAEAFLTALAGGRVNEAYATTTVSFRRKHPTLDEFEAFVRATPALAVPQNLTEDDPNQRGGRHQYSINTTEDRRVVKYTLALTKEGSAWRIDQVTIDPPPPPVGKGKGGRPGGP
jgi:hypothetical protein